MSENQKDQEKVKNGVAILNEIKNIKNQYKAENRDYEEEGMSFLDRVTKLIQLILDDSSISAYEILNRDELDKWKKKRLTRWLYNFLFNNIRKTLYLVLLATITGFLISEAVSFYAIDGVITAKTWIKAILTEVCFIFLSGYRTEGRAHFWWVNTLRAGIFSLMLFVISSQAIETGTKTISENSAISEQITLLERQIADKDKQLQFYKEKNWPKNYTRTAIEKEDLVKKLIKLKEDQASGKNADVSEVERYKMYGRAVFRILLLLISVLITRRIFVF